MYRPICNAFNQNNEPCSNSVDSYDAVCLIHKNFYDPNVWFQRYVFSQFYYDRLAPLVKNIYEKAILGKFVPVTQEHFRNLRRRQLPLESLVDYYLLCCRRDDVDPFWSLSLFEKVMTVFLEQLKPAVYDQTSREPELLTRFLDPIFANTTRSFPHIVCTTLYTFVVIEEQDGRRHMAAVNFGFFRNYLKTHPRYGELVGSESRFERRLNDLLDTYDVRHNSLCEDVFHLMGEISRQRQRPERPELAIGP